MSHFSSFPSYYSLRTPTPYPRTCFLPLALLGSMRLPHDFHRKTWLRPCQKVTETWQFLRLASELGFWYRGRSRHNAISTLVIQRTSLRWRWTPPEQWTHSILSGIFKMHLLLYSREVAGEMSCHCVRPPWMNFIRKCRFIRTSMNEITLNMILV